MTEIDYIMDSVLFYIGSEITVTILLRLAWLVCFQCLCEGKFSDRKQSVFIL